MKILITQALPEEYVDVRLPNAKIEHIYTSIGKAMSAFRLTDAIHRLRPDIVINIGTAGTAVHHIGDILICTRFLDRDLEKLRDFGVIYQQDTSSWMDKVPYSFGRPTGSLCNTGDSFVTQIGSLEGDVVDMEAYAQAQVCNEKHVPFLAIKYVTDIVGQNSVKHWEDKLADARRDMASFFSTVTLK